MFLGAGLLWVSVRVPPSMYEALRSIPRTTDVCTGRGRGVGLNVMGAVRVEKRAAWSGWCAPRRKPSVKEETAVSRMSRSHGCNAGQGKSGWLSQGENARAGADELTPPLTRLQK